MRHEGDVHEPRYRLLLAGVAVDVYASAELDLGFFDARADRYHRSARVVSELDVFVDASPAVGHAPERLQPRPRVAATEDGLVQDWWGVHVSIRGREVRASILPDGTNHFENLLRMITARALLERGGVLLHAAGVRRGALGLAIAGPSGAGKTTLALRIERDELLGDDLLGVAHDERGYTLHSLPFLSSRRIDVPRGEAPLRAIVFPIQGRGANARRLSPREALPLLARCVVSFSTERLESTILDRLTALVSTVPAIALELDLVTPVWPALLGALE